MDKKRRLLDALAPLELPFEKKQDFVNILVEDSGNGGGSNNSTSGLTYFDISSIENSDDIEALFYYADIIKEVMNDNNVIFVKPDDTIGKKALAICCNLSATFTTFDDYEYPTGRITFEEIIRDDAPWILDLPRITEKEFYDNYETFFVYDGPGEFYVRKFKDGMTWREWVDSPYNNGQCFIAPAPNSDEEVVGFIDNYGTRMPLYGKSTSQMAKPDDVLIAGELYFVWVA